MSPAPTGGSCVTEEPGSIRLGAILIENGIFHARTKVAKFSLEYCPFTKSMCTCVYLPPFHAPPSTLMCCRIAGTGRIGEAGEYLVEQCHHPSDWGGSGFKAGEMVYTGVYIRARVYEGNDCPYRIRVAGVGAFHRRSFTCRDISLLCEVPSCVPRVHNYANVQQR